MQIKANSLLSSSQAEYEVRILAKERAKVQGQNDVASAITPEKHAFSSSIERYHIRSLCVEPLCGTMTV